MCEREYDERPKWKTRDAHPNWIIVRDECPADKRHDKPYVRAICRQCHGTDKELEVDVLDQCKRKAAVEKLAKMPQKGDTFGWWEVAGDAQPKRDAVHERFRTPHNEALDKTLECRCVICGHTETKDLLDIVDRGFGRQHFGE